MVTAACALVGGCQTAGTARLSGPLQSPTITFPGDGDRLAAICLDELTVRAQDVVVWSIVSLGERCRPVGQIAYNGAVDGFTTTTPPAALEADTVYDVYARGWSPRFPWRGHGRAVFRDGAWRLLSEPG